MEQSSFVQYMIIIFTIVGLIGNSPVSNNCAKYVEEFCKCNAGDHQVEETPLKMCSYKEGENELCKPCRDVAQDNVTCAECPELACPECNMTSIGLTNEQTMLSMVEDEHGLENPSREKRHRTAHKWCRIENELLSGKFTCRAWPTRKECELKCSVGDEYIKGNRHKFCCDRKENFWRMELKPCEDEEKPKPMSGDVGWPLSRIIASPGHGLKIFVPMSHIDVGHGDFLHGPQYKEPHKVDGPQSRQMGSYHRDERFIHWPERKAYKRSFTELPPLTMSSSTDFEYDEEEVISATRIMPFEYLYDYKLLEPESYWMLSNESSVSYAPYKEDLEVKEEPSNLL